MEYEFIADMIGPGVVGHWVAPGQRDVPDPTEYLKVSGKSSQQRDGKLSFRFLELHRKRHRKKPRFQVKLLAIESIRRLLRRLSRRAICQQSAVSGISRCAQ